MGMHEPYDWFILPLLLPTPTILFSLDRKRRIHNGIRRKWKRSDSSDLDSVVPMTPLMTPIFDFHKFIRAHMTLYLVFITSLS